RDEVRLEFAIAVHRLTPGLRLTHYLESRLGKDVRDHGAHEDGIIADQHRMAHAILRLRAAFGLLKRLIVRSEAVRAARRCRAPQRPVVQPGPPLGPGADLL